MLMLGAFILSTAIVGQARAEPQPRMHTAVHLLKSAQYELKHASHGKGGHRAKAMKHLERALQEVKKGIRYDNRNPYR